MNLGRRLAGIESIVLQGSSRGIGFLSSVILARVLGPENFGIYGFAFTVVGFVAVPIYGGLPVLLVKEVSGFCAYGEFAKLRGIVRASTVIVCVLSVIVAFLVVALAALHANGGNAYMPTLIAGAFLLAPYSMATILGGILRGLGRPILGQLPDAIIRPTALLIAIALVVLWGKSGMTPSLVMWLHVGCAVLAMSFGVLVIKRAMPPATRTATTEYEWRRWLSALAPLSVLVGVQVTNTTIATMMLAAFRTPDEIAFYRVAELAASLVFMPLAAVGVHISGQVARLHALGDRDTLQVVLKRAARTILFVSGPVALFLIIFGKECIVLFFGVEYERAAVPLVVLCLGQLATASAGVVGIVMNMSGQYRETLMAFLSALVCQATLSTILVPTMGAIGAAVASSVASVVWSQVLFWRVRAMYSLSTHAF